MDNLDQIILDVDGIAVVGEITARTLRSISVRLLEPFGRLTSTSTVPLMAAHRVSYLTDLGDTTARRLLVEMYERAVLFDRHASELGRLWRSTQSLLLLLEAEHPDAPARIAEERRQIRARFRAGEINARENQKLLLPLKQRVREFGRERDRILRQFEDARPWIGEADVGLEQVLFFLGEDETGLRPGEGQFGRSR